MKNAAENRPTHIVRGNVFDALGFSAPEASTLKIKAELLFEILQQVKVKGYTQAQLYDGAATEVAKLGQSHDSHGGMLGTDRSFQ